MMRSWGLIAGSAMALAACSSAEEMGDEIALASTEEQGETAREELERRIGAGAQDALISISTDELSFQYGWPAQAVAIESLNALFEQRADEEGKAIGQQTRLAVEDAQQYNYQFIPYALEVGWEVAADLPRFLSLREGRYVYTGGAHGNSDFGSLVWDREAEQAIDPATMFTSLDALELALREPYCAGLDVERRERLGEGYVSAGDAFVNCPSLAELTLVPSSSDGETFDQIDLMAAPYVAGSYAEGPYVVTLDVTPAILDTVRDTYRGAFSIAADESE